MVATRTPRTTTVHPRVCGELYDIQGAVRVRVGSSPRVRGTPRFQGAFLRRGRFIPACAGNSGVPMSAFDLASVHPRVCGELSLGGRWRLLGRGSSPRVRGTQQRRIGCVRRHRFIPACAGNSSARSTATYGSTVHPRVCGELDVQRGGDRRVERFIPACAGNSWRGRSKMLMSTVHPRVCGELATCRGLIREVDGSSPRVRGTPCRCRRRAETPAGSSPRVRGTRVASQSRRRHEWFIPACAGNSPSPSCSVSVHSVHPRVCGELC